MIQRERRRSRTRTAHMYSVNGLGFEPIAQNHASQWTDMEMAAVHRAIRHLYQGDVVERPPLFIDACHEGIEAGGHFVEQQVIVFHVVVFVGECRWGCI